MAEAKADQEELNDRLFDAVDNNDAGGIDAALAAGANIEMSRVRICRAPSSLSFPFRAKSALLPLPAHSPQACLLTYPPNAGWLSASGCSVPLEE